MFEKTSDKVSILEVLELWKNVHSSSSTRIVGHESGNKTTVRI